MNHRIFGLCLLAFTCSIHAQQVINDLGKVGSSPTVDFRAVRDSGNAYFNTHQDSSEGGAFAKFERWKTFWQDRVWSTNGAPGSFSHA